MRVLYFSDNCSVHNRRFLEKLAGSHHEIWFLDCTRQVPPDWLPGRVRWVTPACTLAAHARPAACAEFVPAFVSAVRTIQPDLVSLPAVQGTVSLVDPVIDPASNTFRARLELPNPDGKVPAGLRCKLQLPGEVTAGLPPPARTGSTGMSMSLSPPAGVRPVPLSPVAQR